MSESAPNQEGVAAERPGTPTRQVVRRTFIGALIAGLMAMVGLVLGRMRRIRPGVLLRPPGSLPEPEFSDACVSCFKCGNVCPNGCIEFHGIGAGLDKAFTPYIKARSRGCILCGKCAEVCPTGAIKPFGETKEGWIANVKMGKARVNQEMCFSYNGRTCGACYRACPLPGQAIKIGLYETPILDSRACVGCGLCEQACLHLPQAIRVIPETRRRA